LFVWFNERADVLKGWSYRWDNVKTLKLPLRSQLINFLKIYILKNKHTYIIINASYEGICVEFKNKNNATLVFLLLNCWQELKIFYDWPLKYNFCQFWHMITRL